MCNVSKISGLLLCNLIIILLPVTATASPRIRYLDEMSDTLTSTQGWGNLGINTAAYASGKQPMTLRIADKEYDHGIGHHAAGEIVINLDNNYLLFETEVGVQWQGGNRGSVIFEVWTDDAKVFESNLITDSDSAVPISISLENIQQLRLVAKDGGDGIGCDMANWVNARLAYDGCLPDIGKPLYYFNGESVDGPMEIEGSYALMGKNGGPHIAFNQHLNDCFLTLYPSDSALIAIPIKSISCPFEIILDCDRCCNSTITLCLKSGDFSNVLANKEKRYRLSVKGNGNIEEDLIQLSIRPPSSHGVEVRLPKIQITDGKQSKNIDIFPAQSSTLNTPIIIDPITDERRKSGFRVFSTQLTFWDWKMQDGIGTKRSQNTYKSAAELIIKRIDVMKSKLQNMGVDYTDTYFGDKYNKFIEQFQSATPKSEKDWEHIWYQAHHIRRFLMFDHPAVTEDILFVKQAPGVFSHQLTQYYGRYARPGGGLFILDKHHMISRQLGKDLLPPGSYMQPEVTHDGQRILFAFCETDRAPEDMFNGDWSRHYHIYETDRDGTYVKQLTEGDYDDFAPKELPNGQIMFLSTRRGGWHRCGGLGCPVYTLTLMDADGSNIRTVSYHETQEWDPSVLNDGRVIYTRWDYVDRNAVYYQQLWTVHPDGTGPVAFYGNHTLNPVGVWEARAIPGSHKIMATAAAHHAMTAGSIILIDPTIGIDGFAPIVRLTPDACFPESEDVLLPHWRGPKPYDPPERTPEMERWPGQCYRSPWPLSEDLFLAAYSYDPIIGEPNPNLANMFGLYLVDAYGNKELIYRDLNISSLWPMPLRERPLEAVLPSTLTEDADKVGTYYLQDVYQCSETLPADTKITGLRILQVLPKSTPVANQPTVGLANASPGKQVLGTVPVEQDGSAYFRAPAGIPMCFQALDNTGQAVHIMRSATYLQPGENASCIGCHEPRLGTPPPLMYKREALKRLPSAIKPGPDGSNPFSYPILVQPVLDKHCIRCHSGETPKGPEGQKPIRLTGVPQGRYTESYNTLAPRVSFSAWGRGDFPEGNSEPTTQPGFFGAKGSALTTMLLEGHQDVELAPSEMERIITWMDTNALFYGTFNVENQAKQQQGERISGPDIQ